MSLIVPRSSQASLEEMTSDSWAADLLRGFGFPTWGVEGLAQLTPSRDCRQEGVVARGHTRGADTGRSVFPFY